MVANSSIIRFICNDMKTAAIDIEMYIALFKIRRNSFPDCDLRIPLLLLLIRQNSTPSCVCTARYTEQNRLSSEFKSKA